MSLYDRIRSPDPYVRLFALLEVAQMRQKAAMADELANALQSQLQDVVELRAKLPIEKCGPADRWHAACSVLVKFNLTKEV